MNELPADLIQHWDAAENDHRVTPSYAEPFAGLTRLPKLAIRGAGEYLRLAAEPVVYTWDAVAMQGITVGLTGSPGEGKTTLMFLIAVARGVTDGTVTPVLGLDVTPAPDGHWIVIIEAEHGEASAARKLVKSAHALGLDPATCLSRVITIARKAVVIGSPEWAEVERMIEAGIVSDVFVDSIARVAPADANDEQEQAKIFGGVAKAIERSKGTQPTFWMVMHSRKGMSTGNTEDISGSTQRGGQVDTAIRCTAVRDDDLRVRHVEVTFPKLREEPDEHPGKRAFAIERVADRWAYRDVDAEEREHVRGAPRRAKAEAKAAETDARRDIRLDTFRAVVRDAPGITTNDLIAEMRLRLGTYGKTTHAETMRLAEHAGWLRTDSGPNRSKLHYLQESLSL